MIKLLLLDADGVLINVGGEMASRYFEREYGISHSITVEFYRGPFVDCLIGKKDMMDVLPAFLKKWGWKKSTQDFVDEWFDFENKLNHELLNYIQGLRDKGISCWIATNQDKHRANYFMENMGLIDEVDGIFASSHLGHMKPAKEFFLKILKKFDKLNSKQVLFWDDSEENVQAAKEVDINAEKYIALNDFKDKMESYLK